MYAPQPPSRPEPTWSRPPTVTPGIPPPPPSYLPQPIPPQVVDIQAGRSAAVRLRIPLDRPLFTRLLLAILVLIYIPMLLSPDISARFLAAGQNEHLLIEQGEWWRLITAMFLHAPPPFIIHIALNGYALYVIGMDLEALVGRWRFLVIYFVSGFAGSVASFAFSPANVASVGASGAIFGLVGALGVYFGLHRRLYGRMGTLQFWNIILVIVINMGIGFSGFFPIDNSAHVGGLLAGAAIGYVLCPRYALGEWASPIVRNLVNTNKGTLTWLAAALVTLIIVFLFIAALLMFQAGVLTPTYMSR